MTAGGSSGSEPLPAAQLLVSKQERTLQSSWNSQQQTAEGRGKNDGDWKLGTWAMSFFGAREKDFWACAVKFWAGFDRKRI